MEKLNSRNILKEMAPALNIMSADQLEWLKNKALELLRDKSIEEIHSPYIRDWSFQAQRGHVSAYVRKAVQAEKKLNGPDAAERLKQKLYPCCRYQKLTPEEKEARMSDYLCLSNAMADCYMDNRRPVVRSKWQAKGSIFNHNGKENGSEGY